MSSQQISGGTFALTIVQTVLTEAEEFLRQVAYVV